MSDKRKLYKGNDLALEKISVGEPVQFLEDYPQYNGYLNKVPNVGIITVAQVNSYDKRVFITCRNKKGELANALLPKDSKVRVLTGTVGKDLLTAYEKWTMDNITNNLAYSGSIGSDPEIFVEDKDGNIIPAFKFLPDKKKPLAATGNIGDHYGGAAYWDGFQAEFTTRPYGCLGYGTDSVYSGLKTVYDAAKKFDPNAHLSAKTVFMVPNELLQSSADEHVNFGCMPSMNAYGLKAMEMPARELNARSAGGHMHFGIGPRTKERMENIVKTLDAILAVSCVSLFEKHDNPMRRQFYGLPGEYRTPAHGLEYRVLSNAWLFHPFITNMVFDLGRRVCALGNIVAVTAIPGYDEQETIETIGSCDVERAHKIMDRNKDLIKKLFASCRGTYSIPEVPELLFNVMRNGMESAIENPADIEKNWRLASGYIGHAGGDFVGKNVKGCYAGLLKGMKF